MAGVKMMSVLTAICAVCGFLLAGVKHATGDRIEDQTMRYVKGPAVKNVLAAASNDPVQDRQSITLDGAPLTAFLGKKEGALVYLAYETIADGFGGELGVMVGYDLKTDKLLGIAITSHKETPGVGSRVTQDDFTDRFIGKSLSTIFRVQKDGGEIDAVTGATISSRAACAAVQQSAQQYAAIKAKIAEPPSALTVSNRDKKQEDE